ncbi:MAG: alpha/beta fold hydrolase, partial [Frankia sp.]|nr:alpha/beta fold hydrolase [Frankia sp.]
MQIATDDGFPLVVHDLGGVEPGEGPAVLVCHATGFCGRAYQPLARHLGSRAHVWALDFLGHGQTPPPPDGDFRWSRMASAVVAAVRAIREAAGGAPVHAVGHSMGGACTLQAAADHPDLLVSAYVYEPVVMPSSLPVGPNVLAIGARARREVFPTREAALWRYASRPPLSDLSADSLAAYVEHGFEDLPDGTVRLRCRSAYEAATFEAYGVISDQTVRDAKLPVLVAASRDPNGPSSFVPALLAALPNARSSEHP